jgi:hypothetical protein
VARQVNGIPITEANRFSEYVHPQDIEGVRDLNAWMTSFHLDGVAAVLVFTDKGYAVYREGMEEPFDDID